MGGGALELGTNSHLSLRIWLRHYCYTVSRHKLSCPSLMVFVSVSNFTSNDVLLPCVNAHLAQFLNRVFNVKVVVAAFNQEKALVGAFSVITNLRMELFEALVTTSSEAHLMYFLFQPRDRVVLVPVCLCLQVPGLLLLRGG